MSVTDTLTGDTLTGDTLTSDKLTSDKLSYMFRFIINNDIIFLYGLFFVCVFTCSIVKIILQIYTLVIY